MFNAYVEDHMTSSLSLCCPVIQKIWWHCPLPALFCSKCHPMQKWFLPHSSFLKVSSVYFDEFAFHFKTKSNYMTWCCSGDHALEKHTVSLEKKMPGVTVNLLISCNKLVLLFFKCHYYKGCYTQLELHLSLVSSSAQLVSLFPILLLSGLNGYDKLIIGRSSSGCPRNRSLYRQDSIARQWWADVLQVHPLWQPWTNEDSAY